MKENPESTSQDNLSDFFKLPVGILWVGRDGTILKATQNELKSLGYKPGEVVGQNIKDIHADKETIENILQKIKAGVEINDFKTQLLCKDGSIQEVLINSDVEREDGDYIHTRFFIRDVTEHNKRELTNALLAAIIDNSNDAIISKDLDGIITSWNDSAERIFGYSAKEAIGESITLIIPDERLEEETEILRRIRNGERVDHFETIREHKDGTRLYISLNISPIKDSEGTVVGASKIARDISQQKQAEANLRAYQKQLRSLVAELSQAEERERQRLASELHDNLGQLLSISKMKLDELGENSSPDNIMSHLDELRDLVNKANSYTRELMAELKPPPALEQEHFGTALNWIADKMIEYDLEVTIENDDQPKPLNDEIQTVLLQSLKELLFNVIKHAGVQEAKIILSRLNNQVKITVEDKGEGFDPEQYTSDSVKEGRFGLFNIREQIDLLGGNFDVETEPKKGTKVTITAPLDIKEKAGSEASLKPAEPISTIPTPDKQNGKIKVLLADDHKMMRKGIRNLIETENDFTVIGEASDGKEAVKLAQGSSPDVIIMDINMPHMNGIEATKKILSENSHPIIIGLSVHDSKDVVQAMKKAGASAYLSKNEVFETLCTTIRNEARSRK